MDKKEKEAKKLQLKISQEFGLLSLCSDIKTRMVFCIMNNEEPLNNWSIVK